MDLLLITALTVAASMVGTMTGFGTSTIMVPILLMFYPAPQTLLLVGIIHWFGNLWKLLLFGRGFKWRLVLSFGLPGIAATYLGASLTLSIPSASLARVMGAFLVAYVIWLSLRSSFKVKRSLVAQVGGGTLSGFMAGLFGIGGAVRAVFLSAFNLPKAVYIATAGAIALFVDTTRLTRYLIGGVHLESRLLWAMPFFIAASFLGANIAKQLVDVIPQKHFRTVVAVFLFLVALKLLFLPA